MSIITRLAMNVPVTDKSTISSRHYFPKAFMSAFSHPEITEEPNYIKWNMERRDVGNSDAFGKERSRQSIHTRDKLMMENDPVTGQWARGTVYRKIRC